jgi:hypothetical protein
MPQHPLELRVQAVSAKARRLLVAYALAAVVATAVGAVVVWGSVDYWLRTSETGVKAIASLAILAVTLLVAIRVSWPAWRQRLRLLSVAQRIEQRFPELGDRLSSSLAFLAEEEHDKLAGSATLRRAVVADTMSRADGLDFTKSIDGRSAWRMMALAAAVLLVAGLLTAVHPSAARLVVIRTLLPWSTAAWPRRHQLVVAKAPQRLPTGGDFEAVVIDEAGKLPNVVTIVYQFEGDRPDQEQRREMALLDGKMIHRLEGVTRSFRYRAMGGDDESMPWSELRVLEPPRIASLDVRVIPPAYTGWPAETASPDFRALEGSRVELSGAVDKPIQSATLILEGGAQQPDVGIAISGEGRSLKLPAQQDKPWLLAAANAYALELTSTEGFTTKPARYDLRVMPDRPPVVMVEQPADNVTVTPRAVLPIRVLVKDDLAIVRVELKYLRSDESDEGEQTIELYAGPATVAAVKTSPLKEGTLPGESRPVEFSWNLSELKNLAPGVTLTWHVAASDYKPQTGVSPAQRLAIISQEELEDRIAQRQNAILLQLQEALRKEQKTRSDVAALSTQLATIGRLGKPDLDQLQSAELEQRQIQRSLASETDGVLSQIRVLLDELESNRVDSAEVVRRMTNLSTEIERLGRGPLAAAERELNTALKVVRDDLDKNGDVPTDNASAKENANTPATTAALTATAAAQDETITTLERLLGDLEEFDNYRRFAREVSRLRADQQTLQKETAALQPKTISKNVRDLSPQELAGLRRAAQKQTELARQIDKLVGRMGEARTKLTESQPVAASTLADALEVARRAGISSQMLDGARSIEQNQLGNAGEQQREVAESLNELADILSNRKEHELGRRIKQLRETASELQSLQQQLKGLKQRAVAAAKVPNETERKRQLERLAKEQKRAAEEAQRLARRLERLQSEKASQQVAQGGGKSNDAGQASQQGAGDKALDDLAAAEKHLEEAQQQLQQDIAKAEQDLFFEQVAKLEQAIQGLVARQKTVIEETVRLEGLKTNQQGEWTASQRTSVRSLSEQERDLVGETTAFAQKLKEAAAFGLALEGAVREMTRATARLDRALTDAPTQAAEQIALARLEQLLEALKPEPPMEDQAPEQPMGDPPGGNQAQMPPGDAIHLLAELKLLRLMQQEINRRTAELEKLTSGASGPTAEQEKELEDLAVEQGKLADLVLALGEKAAKQAAAAAAENNPAATDGKPGPAGNNPLDEELNKSLDNELLPGRE